MFPDKFPFFQGESYRLIYRVIHCPLTIRTNSQLFIRGEN